MDKDFERSVNDFYNLTVDKVTFGTLEPKEMERELLEYIETLSQCPLSCDFWLPRNCKKVIQELIKHIGYLEKK